MCKQCLRDAFPARHRTTLEGGSYILNFAGCHACGKRTDFLSEKSRIREEVEDADEDDPHSYEETIEFDHCCASCNHVVAKHFYEFRIWREGLVQRFSMSCALCGSGEDECEVKPFQSSANHPQQQQQQQQRAPNLADLEQDRLEKEQFAVKFPMNLLNMQISQMGVNAKSSTKNEKEEDDDDEWH